MAKTEEELEERAEEALSQIENKKYPVLLKECGVKEIVHIGMAFFRKRVKVKYKVVKN